MEKRTKITVRDLNLYYGENHALKDVNMNIRENCVTAFIGPSGCGKSTFLNKVLGKKIAIMSDKPQTTRNKIQGVITDHDSQTIFIDTPGIHKPKHELGKFMTDLAIGTLNEVDAVMFMVNATEKLGRGDQFILEHLKSVKQPVFLVINKIDLITKEEQ